MKRKKSAVILWLAIILLILPCNRMTGSAEAGAEQTGTEEKEAMEEAKKGSELCQEAIDAYVQAVSRLPAYLSAETADRVSHLLVEADGLYRSLSESEKMESEVVAAYGAWESMVLQSQNMALISEQVTVNYISPDQLGDIENLVPRQGESGPESGGFFLDTANCNEANGKIETDVIHDQGTGGNQEMIMISTGGTELNADAKLTVKYMDIGTYYEGRIYSDQNVPGIQVNAIVTISNPHNAERISLYENFWMGGTVNGGAEALGYGNGVPGRADVSITFCDKNWNPVLLRVDAQLIASSISHGYYKGCSYEGISFSDAEAQTTVRIYDQNYGNIGIDRGAIFGLDQTFYGQLADSPYCAECGGPHSGGSTYEDTRSGGTFMVHGVAFYQKSSTWKMTMVTQTAYEGGHDYWFYFTAAPANLTRPQAPQKTVSSDTVWAGEELSYSLKQKLSAIPKDGYGYYGSLVFYDTLPEAVEYLSARMYLDGVDVTSSAGNLTFNADTGKVTYTFSSAYLKNMAYRGQIAELVIDCRLDSAFQGVGTICNRGNVSVCGRVESAEAEFTPLYEIVTADRNVQLTKRIQASDIVFDHGEPIFLLRLQGTDVLGNERTCYGAAVFTREYVEDNTDASGYVSCTVVFDGLMPGVYIASEEVTGRYQIDQVVVLSNGDVDGNCAVFDLTENRSGSAEFVNRKYEQGGFSHSCFVENKINVKK